MGSFFGGVVGGRSPRDPVDDCLRGFAVKAAWASSTSFPEHGASAGHDRNRSWRAAAVPDELLIIRLLRLSGKRPSSWGADGTAHAPPEQTPHAERDPRNDNVYIPAAPAMDRSYA